MTNVHLEMIVDVIEKIEAESANVLLTHHGLVQDPGEDVTDDGAERKIYSIKKRQKNRLIPGVIHRPLDRHELVHLALVHLRPAGPIRSQYSGHVIRHGQSEASITCSPLRWSSRR